MCIKSNLACFFSFYFREKTVCKCMIQSLFDEYRFFSKYPEKELRITAILYGERKHEITLRHIWCWKVWCVSCAWKDRCIIFATKKVGMRDLQGRELSIELYEAVEIWLWKEVRDCVHLLLWTIMSSPYACHMYSQGPWSSINLWTTTPLASHCITSWRRCEWLLTPRCSLLVPVMSLGWSIRFVSLLAFSSRVCD